MQQFYQYSAVVLALVSASVVSQEVGSCYNPVTHAIFCSVDAQVCRSMGHSFFPAGFVSSRTGCCHCCNGCDESAETGTNCSALYFLDGECGHEGGPSEESPYFNVTVEDPDDDDDDSGDVEENIGQGDNAGSCYLPAKHQVFCAVKEEACLLAGGAWYPPGFKSLSPHAPGSGCCHCCAGCNLAAETGTNCSTSRYTDGECGHQGGPSKDSPFFEDENIDSPSFSTRTQASICVTSFLLYYFITN